MRYSIFALALFGIQMLGPLATADEPARPNILVILTDDIGWGDPHCYNADSKIPTPNIDRLAAGGMLFTNAHTPAALCSPTRYSMLTGNYCWRGRSAAGTWGFNVPSSLLPGQKTVAEMVRAAGYRTAMFGKAGIGGYYAFDQDHRGRRTLAPEEWGFDYSYLIPRGHQSPPLAFFENGVAVGNMKGRGTRARDKDWDHRLVGERLLEKAIWFLDDWQARNEQTDTDQPFYLHFCTAGAHGPYAPAKALAGEPLQGVTRMTDHTDMVYETDILTGKLVEALEQRGALENTLIVYTSDNGGIPEERKLGHDAVARLRGKKSNIFEGGQRVPFIVQWPNHVEAGAVRNQLVGAHDIVATALELAGVEKEAGQAIDSVSLVPVLLGQRDDSGPVRDALLVQSSPGRGPFYDEGYRAGQLELADSGKERTPGVMALALYQGEWKLVFRDDQQEPVALYDLQNDLAEENNLIDAPQQRDRIRAMTEVYRDIRGTRYRD